MKITTTLVFLFFIPFLIVAQNKASKGDNFFYGYKYEQAIAEYKKEMVKNSLTNEQKLNLADSYLKTGSYDDAAKIYLEVNKNDTIMSVHRFNKMLQSLAKSADKEQIKTFLRSKSEKLSSELIENAEFNYSLLEGNVANDLVGIEKLGVNSPQGDFSPAFYKDGLLFSSSRLKKSKGVYEPSGEAYLDIYFGKIDNAGNITSTENFTAIPDSQFHQSTPYYSDTLKTFYYIKSNTEDGQMAFDENGKNALAIGSLKENGQFNFILKDLSTSFYYPFFDDKTQRLFFAANFEDSYGGTDLYYVYTNNGQIMSAPVNLGPRINSPGNEIAPYIFNGSLYFSSDVFYGIGGMDIYKSNILVDNSFSIPVNLGKEINSVDDDFGFILKEDEQGKLQSYFASNRQGGKGGDDLYKLTLENAPGLKTFALQGKVVNLKNKTGISNAQIRLLNGNGDLVREGYTSENGDFRIEIPWQKQITVQAVKEGFSQYNTSYSEEGMEELQNSPYIMGLSQLEDLLTENEGKTTIKLDKFYFDKGKSAINSSVKTELDKVVEAVQRFPQLKLKIENHTDSKGSDSYNKKLSQDRADAIKKYLLTNGVSDTSILEAVGYGEEKIKNSCTNGVYCLDFLHKQNERTLFVIVN
ncbi:MAG: OmpA family protein [Maribacter sp.]